jgi:uncharacterized Zn finger protein (UPF0148 family)
MSLHFYWLGDQRAIGRAYANGLYCYHCNIPIKNKDTGEPETDFCPVCKLTYEKEEDNARMIEAGFCSPRKVKPQGVSSYLIFSWQSEKDYRMNKIEDYMITQSRAKREIIIDEKGRRYTAPQFFEFLGCNCPIIHTHEIFL